MTTDQAAALAIALVIAAAVAGILTENKKTITSTQSAGTPITWGKAKVAVS